MYKAEYNGWSYPCHQRSEQKLLKLRSENLAVHFLRQKKKRDENTFLSPPRTLSRGFADFHDLQKSWSLITVDSFTFWTNDFQLIMTKQRRESSSGHTVRNEERNKKRRAYLVFPPFVDPCLNIVLVFNSILNTAESAIRVNKAPGHHWVFRQLANVLKA